MMRLETERLIVREFREEDLEEFAPILADPKVMEYSLSGPLSRDEAQQYLQHRILDHYEEWGYGFWAIVSKKTMKIIGLAGPKQETVDDENCVEIGYRIASSEWGNGYASEAVKTIRDYAFFHLDLDRVIAIIEPENAGSLRVAEKAGFTFSKMTAFHGFNVGIYEIARISVVSFSKQWSRQFEDEKEQLGEVFENFPIVFHHIGSTSIPGCSAKPKIDILGITHDITAVDRFNAAMKEMGYTPLGEYGMKQRRYFTRGGKTPVNLHIFEDSDPQAARHLRFRDFLRDHPDAVMEYSKLKLGLAERYPGNMLQYCLGKETFVKRIDYQAAMNDSRKCLSHQVIDRKRAWSDEEILKAMEANMHLNMTYFAKYVPNIDIIFQPDVTLVASDIPDDTFNYVVGAGVRQRQGNANPSTSQFPPQFLY
ncbi:MAG: GNAT family N-acetyltransferase [Waddliaceae bacterium]